MERKEFEGRTLDEAISAACSYYNAPREKLEIDIVQDSKSGIFGLVGARKAVVSAALAPTAKVNNIFASDNSSHRQGNNERRPRNQRHEKRQEKREHIPFVTPVPEDTRQRESSSDREITDKAMTDKDMQYMETPDFPPHYEDITPYDNYTERFSYSALDRLDQQKLRETVFEISKNLVEPLADQVELDIEIAQGKVSVHIHSTGDMGILIGRDGQTLSCLQYLAGRMVTKSMGSPVRLQFDAGEYRKRQDARLHDMALALGERVKETGRPYNTRPLSAYQRRIVHMALRDDPNIQTRSSGEGQLKRVIIQCTKNWQ